METYSSPILRASSSARRSISVASMAKPGSWLMSPLTVGRPSSIAFARRRTPSGSAFARFRTGATMPPSCSSSAASTW